MRTLIAFFLILIPFSLNSQEKWINHGLDEIKKEYPGGIIDTRYSPFTIYQVSDKYNDTPNILIQFWCDVSTTGRSTFSEDLSCRGVSIKPLNDEAARRYAIKLGDELDSFNEKERGWTAYRYHGVYDVHSVYLAGEPKTSLIYMWLRISDKDKFREIRENITREELEKTWQKSSNEKLQKVLWDISLKTQDRPSSNPNRRDLNWWNF